MERFDLPVEQRLDETENFVLVIGELTNIPEMRGVLGYRIRSKRTGVVEAEGVSEAGAIRALHACEDYMQRVLKDPDGSEEMAAAQAAHEQAVLAAGFPPLESPDILA